MPKAVDNPDGVKQSGGVARAQWKSDPLNMGYKPVYPYDLPPGGDDATSVSMDSKGNLWVIQRTVPGMPQLFKFGPHHKLILSLGDKELGGHQDKPHGLRIDTQDCDESGDG